MFRDSCYFINYMDGVMSDKYELVDYKGLERPEYILRNGKALNIYGAKKILESQQVDMDKLTAENKRLREALEWAEDYTPHSGNSELNPATKALSQEGE